MKKLLFATLIFFTIQAAAQRHLVLTSPDGKTTTKITVGKTINYALFQDEVQVLENSPISMTLSDGEIWGVNSHLRKIKRHTVNQEITSPFYKKNKVRDNYHDLVLSFSKSWSLEFRAYNDGVAYRFVSARKKPFIIKSENITYRFIGDELAYVPYVRTNERNNRPFFNSFENTYTIDKLSSLDPSRLAFLPLIISAPQGKKICISESDLKDYPGTYLEIVKGKNELTSVMAPYPKTTEIGGHNNLEVVITSREDFIAKVYAPRTFPWRMAIISREDKDIANSDMTYKLAAPSKIEDISWIKPGKVIWDWWNDWNIKGVDFVAGINNNTYKYYIDFAHNNGLEYIILDEGWAVNLKCDLFQVVDSIDLQELVDYGKARNIGVVLWAGYKAFEKDMDHVCKHYSEMGIKGFKVDFMDRDDQVMIKSLEEMAQTAAKYKLFLDFHGVCKPAGFNRTYPNLLNFEGVFGMEQLKWHPREGLDMVAYDAALPFIRQVAGPMDYTQGAMRNAIKENYYPSNSEPMSQGTRMHQLAEYIVFFSPFSMLCDAPTNYESEKESVEFIANIPTVWDETITLEGTVGQYIVTACRKGNIWYIGGITNWDVRDLNIDLSVLDISPKEGTLYKDGMNAHRIGSDYKKLSYRLPDSGKLPIHMAPGGGFVYIIEQ
ncbi:MAG: glycoside hydrolase family 97 protein [Bacteroidaceae bacterium]